jgi:hypothetical protein
VVRAAFMPGAGNYAEYYVAENYGVISSATGVVWCYWVRFDDLGLTSNAVSCHVSDGNINPRLAYFRNGTLLLRDIYLREYMRELVGMREETNR